MEAELVQELKTRSLDIDPEVLLFLQSICKNARISVEDTVNSYEAVVMKYNGNIQDMRYVAKLIFRVDQLRQEINKEISTIKGSVLAHKPVFSPSPPTKRPPPQKLYKEETKKARTLLPRTQDPLQTGPLGKHQIVKHNTHLSNIVNPLANLNIQLVEGVTSAYQLLADTNEKRRQAMLQKAAAFIRLAFPELAGLFKNDGEEHDSDQEEGFEMHEEEERLDELVGMIMPIQSVLEGADNDRLLNEASAGMMVLVENRKRPRNLKVYKLSFMELEQYQFYAGQIVRLRGVLQLTDLAGDASMKKLTIREVVPPRPLLNSERLTLRERTEDWEDSRKPSPMKIIIATGPFFKDDSINLALLQQVGIRAKESCANAIVLMGPFLPKDNNFVKEGMLAVLGNNRETSLFYTYQEYVRVMIDTVQKGLEGHRPNIVIIPAPDDQASMTGHPLPQPPLQYVELEESKPFLRKSLFTLPNPSIVTFNDITVGFINADVVKDLVAYSFVRTKEDEQGRPKMKQNVVLPLLFENNSFFPVFPSGSAPVALSEWRGLEMKEAPDILITSSNYLPFFRNLEIEVTNKQSQIYKKEVGVLNPVKTVVGGVVELTIAPPTDMAESVVSDRLRIDTLQI